jgi:hypothetical protein
MLGVVQIILEVGAPLRVKSVRDELARFYEEVVDLSHLFIELGCLAKILNIHFDSVFYGLKSLERTF